MWRSFVGLALVAGCNSILGIHDLPSDAGPSGPDADPCTGTCECKIDTDCTGAHTVCLDMTTSRVCDCAAGYTKDNAGACSWTGVVANPGFMTMAAWSLVGMATIDTTFAGQIDPGAAQLVDQACTSDVGVTQQVVMPRLSRAEPLVVTTSYEAMMNKPNSQIGGTVGVGPVWHQGPEGLFGWVTERACLGAAQFAPESSTGRGAPATVAMFDVDTLCSFQGDGLTVDRVDIAPAMAGECPGVGTAINGDAEGMGGWKFTASAYTAGDGAFAGIVAMRGYNNSHGIRLYAAQLCDYTSATDAISIPLADTTGSPALSIYHSTSASYLTLSLDGRQLGLSGGMTPTIERYCVPAALRGGVYPFVASVAPNATGACTNPYNDEAIVDELTVASDPACGSDPAIADPGFESGLSLIGVSSGYGGVASTVADANAHGGARDLELVVNEVCGSAGFIEPIVVPPPAGNAGPAVAFWYRYAQGSTTGLYVPTYKGTFTPVRDGAWHQGLACLDPHQVGRPAQVSLFVESTVTGVACGTANAAESASIDDLSVTTDPSCPTM